MHTKSGCVDQLLSLVVATEDVDYHLLLADLTKFAMKRTVVDRLC